MDERQSLLDFLNEICKGKLITGDPELDEYEVSGIGFKMLEHLRKEHLIKRMKAIYDLEEWVFHPAKLSESGWEVSLHEFATTYMGCLNLVMKDVAFESENENSPAYGSMNKIIQAFNAKDLPMKIYKKRDITKGTKWTCVLSKLRK